MWKNTFKWSWLNYLFKKGISLVFSLPSTILPTGNIKTKFQICFKDLVSDSWNRLKVLVGYSSNAVIDIYAGCYRAQLKKGSHPGRGKKW